MIETYKLNPNLTKTAAAAYWLADLPAQSARTLGAKVSETIKYINLYGGTSLRTADRYQRINRQTQLGLLCQYASKSSSAK